MAAEHPNIRRAILSLLPGAPFFCDWVWHLFSNKPMVRTLMLHFGYGDIADKAVSLWGQLPLSNVLPPLGFGVTLVLLVLIWRSPRSKVESPPIAEPVPQLRPQPATPKPKLSGPKLAAKIQANMPHYLSASSSSAPQGADAIPIEQTKPLPNPSDPLATILRLAEIDSSKLRLKELYQTGITWLEKDVPHYERDAAGYVAFYRGSPLQRVKQWEKDVIEVLRVQWLEREMDEFCAEIRYELASGVEPHSEKDTWDKVIQRMEMRLDRLHRVLARQGVETSPPKKRGRKSNFSTGY